MKYDEWLKYLINRLKEIENEAREDKELSPRDKSDLKDIIEILIGELEDELRGGDDEPYGGDVDSLIGELEDE